MGNTIIEKIIRNHTRDTVEEGRIVWMDLDVRSARDFGGPNVVKNYIREFADTPVADPGRTFFTFDLCVPACSLKYADNQQICREFAGTQGIKVFDVDAGIGSHVMMEKGLAVPGSTVVGTDSHLNIMGAVGCFGQGMGDVDITFGFKTGRTWFKVPPTLKVELKGTPSDRMSAKDLTLLVLKHLGTKAAALQAVEFYGEAVRNLSFAGRITLCSMVTEMAGIIGFIPEANGSVEKEWFELTSQPFSHPQADRDAHYSDCVSIDVSGGGCLIAEPFLPTNVRECRELKNVRIQSGFIGSCTNGRAEDLRAAAKIMKGSKVKEGVMLKVVPATRRVYAELLADGTLSDLFLSGAIIGNPGCAGCADGHVGLTGKGEVQISTGNRNFEGKQGKGLNYLAGPETVAASCLTGFITSPEDLS